MGQYGEVIHGHYGQYVTRQYGEATESEVRKFFLQHTERGSQSSCSYMIFLGLQGFPYIWSTFAAEKEVNNTIADYQHVVYQDGSLQNIHDITGLLSFPFMSAEEINNCFGSPDIFCAEMREKEIEKHGERALQPVEIPGETLVDLACYCVYKTEINSKQFLRILVPKAEADYDGYCLSVIREILNAVPVGLRKYMSFATNTTASNEKFFGVLFQRDTGEQCPYSVRLDRGFPEELIQETYLQDEIKGLIAACVDDPSVVEECYAKELETEKEKLDIHEFYSGLYVLHILNNTDLNAALLKKINEMLIKGQQGYDIENIIQNRLTDMEMVEEALEQDGEFKAAQDIRSILQVFGCYSVLLGHLKAKNMHFSDGFCDRVMQKIPIGEDEEAVQKQYQELDKYEDKLAQYIDRECVDTRIQSLEVLKNVHVKKRLMDEILNKPERENVEKAFAEAGEIRDDFKAVFGTDLCKKILYLYRAGQLDDNVICSLYFVIEPHLSMPDEYTQICVGIYVKKCKCSIWEEPQKINSKGAILEQECKNFNEKFPEYLSFFIEQVSEEFVRAYSENEEVSHQEIRETIEILKKYSPDKKERMDLIDLYYKRLQAEIEKDPKPVDIEESFQFIRKYRPKERTAFIKNVCKGVKKKFDEIEKEEFGKEQYEGLCRYISSLNQVVQENAPDNLIKYYYPEKTALDNSFDSCLRKHLKEYLRKAFGIRALEMIFQYVYQLMDQHSFYEEADEIILHYFGTAGLSIDEIKEIYAVRNQNFPVSYDLEDWYTYWIKEGNLDKDYRRMLEEVDTYAQYFYYCRNKKGLLTTIPEGKKRLLNSFINKLGSTEILFSSFLSGIISAEGKHPLYILWGEDKEEKDFYTREFYSFYKDWKIGIRLKENMDLFDIDTQLLIYEWFLVRCGLEGVYFYGTNGEYIGIFKIKAVKNALREIRKISDGHLIDNEEECLGEYNQEYIEMLKPYFCPEEKKCKSQEGHAGLKNKFMDFLKKSKGVKVLLILFCIAGIVLSMVVFRRTMAQENMGKEPTEESRTPGSGRVHTP